MPDRADSAVQLLVCRDSCEWKKFIKVCVCVQFNLYSRAVYLMMKIFITETIRYIRK